MGVIKPAALALAAALAMLPAIAASPHAAPRVTLERTLPVDSARADVAAHVLPVGGGALIAGWTTGAGEAPDALLLRVDRAGDVRWRRHFGKAGTDLIFSVAPDGAGGYVCAGFVAGRGAGGTDGWVFAVDSAGAMRWERLYGGAEDERLISIQRAGDGWIVAGQTSRDGNVDAWILRLDDAGHQRSAMTWGGAGVERALGLLATDDGGCVIVGGLAGADGDGDAFVTRLDRNGTPRWTHHEREPGRQVAYHLRRERDGGFLVTGYGFVDSLRDCDGRLTRIGANGKVHYRRTLGTEASDRAVQSVVLGDGAAIVIGYSRPRAGADDQPVWTAMLYAVDPRGRVTWSQPVGGPGRESGRWIAGDAGDLWAVGQSATASGGSAVLLIRIEASHGRN